MPNKFEHHKSTLLLLSFVVPKKKITHKELKYYNGFVPDCSNSIANELQFPQTCTKPST